MLHMIFDLLSDQSLYKRPDFTNNIRQLDYLRSQCLLTRKCQQLAGQCRSPVRIILDLLNIVIIAVSRRMAQKHEIACTDDRCQDIIKVMRDTACQLAHSLHLGRLCNLAFQLILFAGVCYTDENRSFAQSANPGKTKRNRLFRANCKPHCHVAACGRTAPMPSDRIRQSSFVFAHNQIGWERGHSALLAIDGSQKGGIAEQEAAVTIRHRKT